MTANILAFSASAALRAVDDLARRKMAELSTWMTFAEPGDTFVYHTGNLAQDRLPGGALERLAGNVWDLARSGRVTCLQRKRRGSRDFEYICVRGEFSPPDPIRQMIGGADRDMRKKPVKKQ